MAGLEQCETGVAGVASLFNTILNIGKNKGGDQGAILSRLFKNPEKRKTKSETKGSAHVNRQGSASVDLRKLLKPESIQDRMKSLAEAENYSNFEK